MIFFECVKAKLREGAFFYFLFMRNGRYNESFLFIFVACVIEDH